MPARPGALHLPDPTTIRAELQPRPCFTHPSPSGTSSSATAPGSRRCASTPRATACRPTGTSSHLGARATGGAGAVIVEASARRARGPHQPRRLRHLVGRAGRGLPAASRRSSREHGAVPGIQIAHAGRKASVVRAVARRQAARPGGARLAARRRRARSPTTTAGTCRASSATSEIGGVVEAFAAVRPARARGRLPAARDARRARLPAARVPLAALEPPQRCLRRRLRRTHAAAARGRRGGAGGLAGRAAAGRAHLGQRLGRGRLVARRLRRARHSCSSRSASISSTAPRAATRRPQQIALGPGYQVPFAAAIRERRRHRNRRGRPDHRAAAGRGHPPGRRRRRRAARPRVAARCLLAAARRASSSASRATTGPSQYLRARPRVADAALIAPLRLSVLDQSPIARGRHRRRRRSRTAVDLAQAHRRARLRALLGRGASRHADAREHRARDPDRRDRGRDRAHPRRQRRRDAAALQPAQGGRDVQHARRPARRPHRPRHRPRARLRPRDDVRAAARPAPVLAGRLSRAARGAARVLRERLPGRATRSHGSRRCRASRAGPTSGCSAPPRRARSGRASSGCPTPIADFINPDAAANAQLYRERFAGLACGVRSPR